ncbi:hypothetical protein J2Y48_000435 [Mycoplana sp. BE70]|nr:hypothetical protein [Mycoplana sp. BE70]
MSSMFGSFAGIGTYNWLFNNDEQQQQQAPVAVPGAAN